MEFICILYFVNKHRSRWPLLGLKCLKWTNYMYSFVAIFQFTTMPLTAIYEKFLDLFLPVKLICHYLSQFTTQSQLVVKALWKSLWKRENAGNLHSHLMVLCFLSNQKKIAYILTLSQTTNFRLFQTERVCRRQL